MKEQTAAPAQAGRMKPRNRTIEEKEFGFTKSFDSFEDANAWEREGLPLAERPRRGRRRTAPGARKIAGS